MDHLEALIRATTPSDVLAVLRRAAADHGATQVSYRAGPDATTLRVFQSTLPADWLRYYMDAGYREIDPAPRWARTQRTPFFMCFDPAHPTFAFEGTLRQMTEEMQELDVRGAYMVPMEPAPGETVAVAGFYCCETGESFDRWIEAHQEALQVLASAAHSRIGQLLRDDLRALQAAAVKASHPELTEREREVLSRVAKGARMDRISEAMGISARTVEFHAANARKKLGARTREQAVAIALVNGLIHP